jgi:hypothetical protein
LQTRLNKKTGFFIKRLPGCERQKGKKMREALKNAIAPGRTRAGSNVETLVDAVEI